MATALGKVRETWNQIANESGPIEVAQAAHNMAQITALATIALAEQQEIANKIALLTYARTVDAKAELVNQEVFPGLDPTGQLDALMAEMGLL